MFYLFSFSLSSKNYSEVIIEKGTYYLNSSFIVEENTKYIMDGVNFVGGAKLKGFKKVTDNTIRNYFDSSVRDKIFECNLRENGVNKIFDFLPRGFGYSAKYSHNHLYIDGQQMNIAQYPKLNNFIQFIGPETPQKINSVGCDYNDTRPQKWHTTKGIYSWGYWNYGWSGSTQKVTEFDREKMHLVFGSAKDATVCKKKDRFFLFNIIEEVMYPGDFYIDNETLMLYFYPFDGFNPEKSDVILSNSTFNLVQGYNIKNTIIEGLTISAAKEIGILITGSNITLERLTVKNTGQTAISLQGNNNVIRTCTIHNTLEKGIYMTGGNRATLERGNCLITNCSIYWFGNMSRNYAAGIILSGVGNTVSHCHIHHGPHEGIGWSGNDHLFEYNEINHVITETTDAGMTYSGRDYTWRGNVFRHNYLHDVTEAFAMGLYNDDCLSGSIMYNNVFVNISRAVMLGGGRDFIVKNNIFIACHPAVSIDGRCASTSTTWRNMVMTTLHDRFYTISKNVSAITEPYKSRYPELSYIHSLYQKYGKEPFIYPSAEITNNVFMNNTRDFSIDQYAKKGGEIVIRGYLNASYEDFVDYNNSDFTISPNSDLVSQGFEPFNMKEIGLIHYSDAKEKHLTPGAKLMIFFAVVIVILAIAITVYAIREKKAQETNSALDNSLAV